MTTGTLETKGTRVYFAAAPTTIHKVACPSAVTGLGGAADQIDITCLDSLEREYKQGLANPGQITIPINFIARSAAHQSLLDLKDSGETISWMVVLSDHVGAGPTTVTLANRLISPGPTTAEFLAYVSDITVDIGVNEVVRASLVLQRSGAVDWNLPTADLA